MNQSLFYRLVALLFSLGVVACSTPITNTDPSNLVCDADYNCPTDYLCKSGKCAKKSAVEGTCTSNTDCKTTEECKSGKCEVKVTGACASNADCKTGEECKSGKCEAKVTGVCASNTDCKTGEECKSGKCEVKVTGACASDADCKTGEECKSGKCEVKVTGACASDAECKTGEECKSGKCETKQVVATYPKGPYGVNVGDVMPDIAVKDCEGKEHKISDILKNTKAKVLYFTLHTGWCSFCKQQSQQMRGQKDTYGDKLEIWNILTEDTTAGSKKVPKTYCEKHATDYNFNFPQYVDEGAEKTGIFFDKKAYPLTMVVTVPGMVIQYKKSGALPEGNINATFDQLINQ